MELFKLLCGSVNWEICKKLMGSILLQLIKKKVKSLVFHQKKQLNWNKNEIVYKLNLTASYYWKVYNIKYNL
jgi:hypothetical protein